jgi:hypothetical protein
MLSGRASAVRGRTTIRAGTRSPLPPSFQIINGRIAASTQHNVDTFHDEVMNFHALIKSNLAQRGLFPNLIGGTIERAAVAHGTGAPDGV